MARETGRASYVQRIDPEYREEYVEAHDDVPDGVTAAMERGTVTAFDLFVRDDIAVCILEAVDLDAYLEAGTGDPAVNEWERHLAQLNREDIDIDVSEDQ